MGNAGSGNFVGGKADQIDSPEDDFSTRRSD
jgi:hypothetical protein